MARGKDAPAITGGQIDPYVAGTLQRGKEMKQSRLLAAMKEKGATERAGIASSTQLQTAGIQQETSLKMQAAQSASDDRRAAEAERGRREDMKFTETMQQSTRTFQAKQAELSKEHQLAMVKGDRDFAEKIRAKQESLRRFAIEKQTAAQERSTNAILSVVKGSLNRESAKEKALTVLSQEADKFDKDKTIYERTKTRVIENVGTDRRLDLPIVGKFTLGKARGFAILPGVAPPVGKELIPGTQADPMGVLQDQFDKNKAGVSVEQLAPENIHLIEDALQNGTLSAEEIRSTLGVLEGMKDVLEQKRKANPLSAGEDAYDFWNGSYQSIIDMRDAVEGLADSPKKVTDNEQETVGSRVQYALGVIRDNSLGGRASRLRELSSGNFEAVFEDMTKQLQIPSLWDINPEMTDYEREIREDENAMLMRLYPNLGGAE